MENKEYGRLLGLRDPWEVKDMTMSGDLSRVDITVGIRSGRPLKCPECGGECKVHDTVRRTWRHLDLWEAETFVTADIPRTKCGKCGILQIDVPWARDFVSYTYAFEKKALNLLRSMPVNRVAETMGIGRSVLERMIAHHVNIVLDAMDLSSVRNIMIDETSSKKGHRYITVITDADEKKIIFMTEGRGADTLKEFKDWLIAHNGNPRKIRWVSCDFSIPFLSGLKKHFKRAGIVYDGFHLVKMVNAALDKIRSKNQINGQRHKRIRFALLRNRNNLSDEEKTLIFDIRNDNVEIGKAYEMKESLVQLYDYPDLRTAKIHLGQWLKWVFKEGAEDMRKVGRTVAKHFGKIVNRFRTGMSNGFLEGLNGMIQTTKRIGRGYPNAENFIRMIYFRHGRLDA